MQPVAVLCLCNVGDAFWAFTKHTPTHSLGVCDGCRVGLQCKLDVLERWAILQIVEFSQFLFPTPSLNVTIELLFQRSSSQSQNWRLWEGIASCAQSMAALFCDGLPGVFFNNRTQIKEHTSPDELLFFDVLIYYTLFCFLRWTHSRVMWLFYWITIKINGGGGILIFNLVSFTPVRTFFLLIFST